MLLDSKLHILAESDVKGTFRILQDINAVDIRHPRKLVAGAGFEPAAFRL
jgi:hypothetical protein